MTQPSELNNTAEGQNLRVGASPRYQKLQGLRGRIKRRRSDLSAKAPEKDTKMGGQHLSDPGPIMPVFLDLDSKEMDRKFEDINWDERTRILKGSQTHPNFDWKWSQFKQTNANEKGLMDRYQNIKPWNHNRVKLGVDEGQLDYVNASEISIRSPSDDSRQPLRYIAMQGPTRPSIPYVWRMIAEQTASPSVIIQLTSNFENGAQKCDQYFPLPDVDEDVEWELNEDDVWEDGWSATLKYESLQMLSNDAIEKRKLTLRVQGEKEPRTIWHFWYRRWPDFGVPAPDDLESFFELMRLSREHSSPKGPRVIHCSAGVGRTGTFIALEHLIRELDVGALCDPSEEDGSVSPQPKPDLIFDIVSDLRQQRKGMVQSEQQYQFLYQALKRLWMQRYGPKAEEDDDEDKTDGGVSLGGTGKAGDGTDPFWDAENEEDVDEDEGGAKVRSNASTPTGWRPKSASPSVSLSAQRSFLMKRRHHKKP